MMVFGGLLATKVFSFFKLSAFALSAWHFIRVLLPIATILVFFLIIYHYMPAKRIGIKKILPGAIYSTIGWIAISQLFSLYIENFGSLAKAYGSLGGIIVLLLWLYWCGISIMLGAELNASLYYFRVRKKRYTSDSEKT